MASRMPNAEEVQEEVVVDRCPEYRGWQIRTKDQLPGEGSVVTDVWLTAFGFSAPSKFNIGKIIDAMAASLGGYAIGKVDLDKEAQKFGDPLSEKGAAADIEFGERLGKYH